MLHIDEARQSAFATLSGDFNPLHVDASQARRSQFGGCVVHGIHLVLGALDALPLTGPTSIASLEANFRSAVMVGELASFRSTALAPGQWRVEVLVGARVQTVVNVSTERVAARGSVANAPRVWPASVAAWPDIDAMAGHAGDDRLVMDPTALATLFPNAAANIAPADLATLLGSTRIVGMHCPGQWALFRRLVWEHSATAPASAPLVVEPIHFRVTSVDKRFSMLSLDLESSHRRLRAEVLLREPPPSQASLASVRQRVDPRLFHGHRALVIGGSRGLGELAAKILAAGGADVQITYHSGIEDAERVACEIGTNAAPLQLRCEQPADEALAAVAGFAPTLVAYFATPIIAKRPPRSWDPSTFERFVSVYLLGFSSLLAAAERGGKLAGVFFPSSSFVDTQPAGFAEYVAAKRAGEAVCQAWQQTFPNTRMVVDRLPPLLTDQTAASAGGSADTNVDVLLRALTRLYE